MTKKGNPKGATQAPTTAKPKAGVYISFNTAETAALQGVCLRSLRVYFELKWLANFKTGAVGKFGRQKLTYEGIAQRVAIPTSQGRSGSQNTIDGKEVARIIQRLEQAGLVKDIANTSDGLTLRLPLSPIRAGKSGMQEEAQEQEAPMTKLQSVPIQNSLEPPQHLFTQRTEEPADDWDDWEEDVSAIAAQNTGIQGEKLPTERTFDHGPNPHQQRAEDESDLSLSVLINTEGQYRFSVPDPVLPASARSALADVGMAGAPTERLGEPCRLTAAPFEGEGNPNLNAGQIRERLRTKYPQFSYLDTAVSKRFFERIEGLEVKNTELDEAALSLANDPTCKLTAGELFDVIVARRRRPRRLGARVAL